MYQIKKSLEQMIFCPNFLQKEVPKDNTDGTNTNQMGQIIVNE